MATQIRTAPDDAGLEPVPDNMASSAPHSSDMRCPDPSVHKTKNTALQDQASAAALYSTSPSKRAPRNPLGPDGKLSSASAATSLKHAQAHELPGFPVVGIDTRSSAGTAATLASANTKSPEWWKPEHSAAAGKAALLANDYKMAPLWRPEASAAGSKAALLAHKDGAKLNLWSPEPSAAGNSAANIAMRKKGLSPNVTLGSSDEQKKKALLAATGAVSNTGRKRAQSNPTQPPLYPDAQNSAKNALSAATIAHSPSMRAAKTQTSATTTDSNRLGSSAMQAARIQHSKVSREMYTERPPVAIEVEEKRRQDALKASAISMAKKMYDVQQQHIDQASGHTAQSHAQTGATAAHSQKPNAGNDDIKQQAMRYIGIQEAAQKLAAERLAKIGPDENAQYRSYYGYEKPRSKLSIRRGRNRASSNPEPADDSDDDDLRSRRIRSQMSQLNKSLAEVDAKKQDQDRKHLLAAAERKVQAQMLGLDKKIFDETGKMSQAMMDEWDAKARARAAANSEARMENHGRVHIGHGKYMDQADIDAVAQARIQPTLDEITEKTEKRRADEEERRLDMEERKRQTQNEKERAAETKAEEKRDKEEEKRAQKTRAAEEKTAARQEKEALKEKQAEEKRMAQVDKRKSVEPAKVSPVDPIAAATDDVTADDDNNESVQVPTRSVQVNQTQSKLAITEKEPSDPTSPISPSSPKSESKGIKSFLNKFKRRSKPPPAAADSDKTGFIGGVALRNSESQFRQDSTAASTHVSQTQTQTQTSERRYSDVSSIASVSIRGRSPEPRAADEQSVTSLPSVKGDVERTVTGRSGASEYEEARDSFNENLAPPPSFTTSDVSAARRGSPSRDSKFHEVGI